MRIGIIGAGFVARAVAQQLLASGHQAMLSNSRGPKTLSSVASGLPGVQIGTVAEAAAFGDTVLVAIPFEHLPSVPAELLAGKILLDANNYYPERDGQIPSLDRFETTTSRLVAEQFPAATVVKVFNAILAREVISDARSQGASDRRALPIAGDSPAAKAQVTTLLDEMGFDTVDAGGLVDSWRFERAKPAYCIQFDSAGLTAALAAAERKVEAPSGSWRH